MGFTNALNACLHLAPGQPRPLDVPQRGRDARRDTRVRRAELARRATRRPRPTRRPRRRRRAVTRGSRVASTDELVGARRARVPRAAAAAVVGGGRRRHRRLDALPDGGVDLRARGRGVRRQPEVRDGLRPGDLPSLDRDRTTRRRRVQPAVGAADRRRWPRRWRRRARGGWSSSPRASPRSAARASSSRSACVQRPRTWRLSRRRTERRRLPRHPAAATS